MGATMMANAIGFMLGPMVGGYFYEYHGHMAPFIFCAALAVLDFLCILFIAEPDKKKNGAKNTTTTDLNDQVNDLSIGSESLADTLVAAEVGVSEMSDHKLAQENLDDAHHHAKAATEHSSEATSYGSTSASSSSSSSSVNDEDISADVSMFEIASNWTITRCLLATFVAASVFSGLEPIFPLYLQDLLNATPTQTGLILIAAIFPTLFASGIGYYADQVGHFYVSLMGMILFTFATFSLAAPTTFFSFVLPLAVFGLGSSMILTPLLPAMADVVNKKGWNCYAKTYALYNMTYSLSMAVGPILAGFIYDDFGFPLTMSMFGVMIAVSTPVIFSSQIATVMAHWKGSRVEQSEA